MFKSLFTRRTPAASQNATTSATEVVEGVKKLLRLRPEMTLDEVLLEVQKLDVKSTNALKEMRAEETIDAAVKARAALNKTTTSMMEIIPNLIEVYFILLSERNKLRKKLEQMETDFAQEKDLLQRQIKLLEEVKKIEQKFSSEAISRQSDVVKSTMASTTEIVTSMENNADDKARIRGALRAAEHKGYREAAGMNASKNNKKKKDGSDDPEENGANGTAKGGGSRRQEKSGKPANKAAPPAQREDVNPIAKNMANRANLLKGPQQEEEVTRGRSDDPRHYLRSRPFNDPPALPR